MVTRILGIFLCKHRRITFPMSRRGIAGDYVVCLSCGKEFEYDFSLARMGKEIPSRPSSGVWRGGGT